MFVIVFGQLAMVLFCKKSNTYGSVFSFFLSLLLRLLCGDSAMNLPASISFGEISVECPTEEDPTKMCTGPVPFRTIVAIIGIVSFCAVLVEIYCYINTLCRLLICWSVLELIIFLLVKNYLWTWISLDATSTVTVER